MLLCTFCYIILSFYCFILNIIFYLFVLLGLVQFEQFHLSFHFISLIYICSSILFRLSSFTGSSFKSHLSYSTRSLRRARNRALFNPCSSSSDPDICPNYVFHYGSSFHGNAGGARTRNPGVSSIRTVTASCQDHHSDERLIECQTDTEQNNRTEYMYSTKQLLRFHSSSVEWTRLSQIERSKLGLKIEQAAEFWLVVQSGATPIE